MLRCGASAGAPSLVLSSSRASALPAVMLAVLLSVLGLDGVVVATAERGAGPVGDAGRSLRGGAVALIGRLARRGRWVEGKATTDTSVVELELAGAVLVLSHQRVERAEVCI